MTSAERSHEIVSAILDMCGVDVGESERSSKRSSPGTSTKSSGQRRRKP